MPSDQFKLNRVTDTGTAVDQLDTAFAEVEQAVSRWTGETPGVDFDYPMVVTAAAASKIVKSLASGKIADGWLPKHCVMLHEAVNAALAHNTDTALNFPSEDIDTDGFHSVVAGLQSLIAIPADLGGTYLFAAVVQFDGVAGAGGLRAAAMFKNGTYGAGGLIRGSAMSVDAPTGLKVALTVLGVAALVPTDYVELVVSHQAGLGKTCNVYSNMFFAVRLGD